MKDIGVKVFFTQYVRLLGLIIVKSAKTSTFAYFSQQNGF